MTDILWFKHDVLSLSDDKIQVLIAEGGFSAYGFYWAIIEAMYKAGGGIPEMTINALAHAAHLKKSEKEKIQLLLVDIGLISVDENKIYKSSRVDDSIQDFREQQKRRSEHGKMMISARWDKKTREPQNDNRTYCKDTTSIPTVSNKDTASKPTEYYKDTKEELDIELDIESSKKKNIQKKKSNFDDLIKLQEPELQQNWKDFVEMRKKMKSPFTIRAFNLSVSTLHKLADTTDKMNAILEQSIQHGYSGLYPIKSTAAAGTTTAHDEWAGIAAGEIRL